MNVRFWGVRGSIPTPLTTESYQSMLARALVAAQGQDLSRPEALIEFCAGLPPYLRGVIGGNTACVEITTDDGRRLICDCGSGARELSNHLLASDPRLALGKGEVAFVFSHTHWDHILGLPFFTPIYIPGNRVRLFGAHRQLESRLRDQHTPRHFPVDWNDLGAEVSVTELPTDGPSDVAGFSVRAHALDHPGGSFAYRIEDPETGRSVIYATDGEFRELKTPEGLTAISEFYRGANAIVFDAMFTFPEQRQREDWGHASGLVGVDLCIAANIPRLVLFHHDPNVPDETVWRMRDVTIEYAQRNYPSTALTIDLARESWSFSV